MKEALAVVILTLAVIIAALIGKYKDLKKAFRDAVGFIADKDNKIDNLEAALRSTHAEKVWWMQRAQGKANIKFNTVEAEPIHIRIKQQVSEYEVEDRPDWRIRHVECMLQLIFREARKYIIIKEKQNSNGDMVLSGELRVLDMKGQMYEEVV